MKKRTLIYSHNGRDYTIRREERMSDVNGEFWVPITGKQKTVERLFPCGHEQRICGTGRELSTFIINHPHQTK